MLSYLSAPGGGFSVRSDCNETRPGGNGGGDNSDPDSGADSFGGLSDSADAVLDILRIGIRQ